MALPALCCVTVMTSLVFHLSLIVNSIFDSVTNVVVRGFGIQRISSGSEGVSTTIIYLIYHVLGSESLKIATIIFGHVTGVVNVIGR